MSFVEEASRVTFLSRFHLVIALVASLSASLHAQEVDLHAPVDDDDLPQKPKVLIIGDSISLGYTPIVREQMADEAEIIHNPGNAQHTGTGLRRIDDWLGDESWEVIHFNWGLWDLCYRHPDSKVPGQRDKQRGTLTTSLDVYESNLEAIVERLQETGATLIWASTTPVPEGEPGRHAGDELRYNQIALEVMERHSIQVNDLHAAVLPEFGTFQRAPDDVHFDAEGYRFLADTVVKELRAALVNREQSR